MIRNFKFLIFCFVKYWYRFVPSTACAAITYGVTQKSNDDRECFYLMFDLGGGTEGFFFFCFFEQNDVNVGTYD